MRESGAKDGSRPDANINVMAPPVGGMLSLDAEIPRQCRSVQSWRWIFAMQQPGLSARQAGVDLLQGFLGGEHLGLGAGYPGFAPEEMATGFRTQQPP